MMKRFMLNIIFILLSLYSFCSCAVNHAPVYVKNGKKYGVVSGNFTDRWYDYYERALSYKNGGYFNEALSDLNRAIEIRRADQRWVNTYGMHFIDYFPHREKGIIYYLLGDYRLSEEELLISMHREPSAKAGHFINQSRIKRMVKEKRPVTPPALQLHYPQSTRDEFVKVSGLVKDGCYVSSISVSGEKMQMAASETTLPFYKQLFLSEGDNHIEIIARNLLGGEIQKRIHIMSDRSGPTIIIKEHIPEVTLSGYLTDRSALRSFQINGAERIHTLKNGFFNLQLISQPGPLLLTASDALGNTTQLALNPDQLRPKERADFPLFMAGACLVDASPFAGSMKRHPEIHIRIDGMGHESVVYKKSVSLKGEIRSTSPVGSIKLYLEGEPLSIALDGNEGHVVPSGAVISFNQSIPVNEGRNTLKISVETVSGNQGSVEMTIIRKIPEIWKPENRFAVRLTPLDDHTRKYERSLLHRLFGQAPVLTGSAGVLEDEKRSVFQEAMALDLLKRKRFQLLSSGINDLETGATQKDPARPALKEEHPPLPDGLLMGNSCVDPWGVEVTVRLVALASFEEIIAADHFSPRGEQEDVREIARDLSQSLHHSLPVIEGKVTAISSGKVLISCTNGKIREGWPVYVYKELDSTPDGPGPSLSNGGGDTAILGLFTMGPDQSVDLKKSNIHVEKGDRVIAR